MKTPRLNPVRQAVMAEFLASNLEAGRRSGALTR
jgi:hypothetical protein